VLACCGHSILCSLRSCEPNLEEVRCLAIGGHQQVAGAAALEGLGLEILVEGDGFLYNMVRILAGTLLEVGCGLRTVEQTAALVCPLAAVGGGGEPGHGGAVARQLAGPTLPAAGLCLEHVEHALPWAEQSVPPRVRASALPHPPPDWG
jgi:hypothetical protein